MIERVFGQSYLVEYSNSLSPDCWVELEKLNLPESPYILIDLKSAIEPWRFYRVSALIAEAQ